ncbi:hypothetical protein SAMN04488057_105183 [Cyclobacterium lianum]|uniref:DUF3828 domain-containing protein n=1 Tax=Cyclobacterium lianum TaxID=388280 RepID=A0A1M7NCM8_9BACT|nr:hypothetical protein [Cyclobacterium lianum]SHN00910.1 hypothetical protein SAMN04488057_105183 [Cyclobacterium lianum]
MRLILLSLTTLFISIISAPGQSFDSSGRVIDDGRFAAATKQVNQFFRRFNAEESKEGDIRYNPGDENYRDKALRRSFINILFDNETSDISNELKREFIAHVVSDTYPQYLNFHGGEWFAEVNTVFNYNGRKQDVILFLKLQPQGLGYEWVIENVNFPPFSDAFNKPEGDDKKFLHPLSHELGFMNLKKAMLDNPRPESYTPDGFQPDYLTLFLFEIKSNRMKFETVKDTKFHFFQIDKWYFELTQFNRPGFNTGWLIANLLKLEEGDKEIILNYIYDRN